MDIFSLSLESIDGASDFKEDPPKDTEVKEKTIREKEHQVFARLLDFSQLKNASHAEIQEQYGIAIERTEENYGKGKVRARKITDSDGNSVYTLTTKANIKEGDSYESTVEIDKNHFTLYKFLCDGSMVKHRYLFPVKGTKYVWEVDAVPDGNGGYYPWVRAEIEVDDLQAELPEFPLKAEEIILPKAFGKLSEEEYKTKTKQLMDRFFVSGNPYLKDKETKATALTKTETKPDTEEKNPPVSTPETESEKTEAEKDKDANTVLSEENITDDATAAKKVEKRAEEIKEAKEEKDADENPDETPSEDETNSGETDKQDDSGEVGDTAQSESSEDDPDKKSDQQDNEEVGQESVIAQVHDLYSDAPSISGNIEGLLSLEAFDGMSQIVDSILVNDNVSLSFEASGAEGYLNKLTGIFNSQKKSGKKTGLFGKLGRLFSGDGPKVNKDSLTFTKTDGGVIMSIPDKITMSHNIFNKGGDFLPEFNKRYKELNTIAMMYYDSTESMVKEWVKECLKIIHEQPKDIAKQKGISALYPLDIQFQKIVLKTDRFNPIKVFHQLGYISSNEKSVHYPKFTPSEDKHYRDFKKIEQDYIDAVQLNEKSIRVHDLNIKNNKMLSPVIDALVNHMGAERNWAEMMVYKLYNEPYGYIGHYVNLAMQVYIVSSNITVIAGILAEKSSNGKYRSVSSKELKRAIPYLKVVDRNN